MEFEMNIGASTAIDLLGDYADRTEDMKPAMQSIRDLLVEGHARNFESRGSFLGEPWPALAPSTLERKARQGLPAQPMVATGELRTALRGGRGRYTSATKTRARAGVNRRLFRARMSVAGAEGGRRGKQPVRSIIGTTRGQREQSTSIIQTFMDTGRAP